MIKSSTRTTNGKRQAIISGDIAWVPLGGEKYPGLYTIIDAEDVDRVIKNNWSVDKRRNTYYAQKAYRTAGKLKSVYLHRFIFGLTENDVACLDHINGNGLDNRKTNLRIATCSQNAMNHDKAKGLSRYRGVYWDKRHKKWYVRITVNKRTIYLGLRDDEIEAAKLYDEAAIKYYGAFAKHNIRSS